MVDFVFLSKLFFINLSFLFAVLIWVVYCLIKRNTKLFKKMALIICISGVVEVFLFKFIFMPDYTSTIKGNWNLQLPNPNKEISLVDNLPSFHGDGDTVRKLIYSDKHIDEVKVNYRWDTATEDVILKVEGFYEKSRNKNNKEALRLSHDTQYLYIYKENNNKYDWILLLLDEEAGNIYIFEHHQ